MSYPTSRRLPRSGTGRRRLGVVAAALVVVGHLAPGSMVNAPAEARALAAAASTSTKDSVVRGRVTAGASDMATAAAYVQLTSASSGAPQYFGDVVAYDGSFAIAAPAGEYVVTVTLGNGGTATYWSAVGLTEDAQAADSLVVAQGVVVDDLVLRLGARPGVSGTVLDDGPGRAVRPQGAVLAIDADETDASSPVETRVVDMSGGDLSSSDFDMDLDPGRYKIALADESNDVVAWYGGSDMSSAAVVEVQDGQRLDGIDMRVGTDAAVPAHGMPRITGSPEVGETLRVDTGSWPSGTTFTYRWSDQSTRNEYKVTTADTKAVVPLVYAHVTARMPGWEPVSIFTPYAAAARGVANESVQTEGPTAAPTTAPSAPTATPSATSQPRPASTPSATPTPSRSAAPSSVSAPVTTAPRPASTPASSTPVINPPSVIGTARVGATLSTDGGKWRTPVSRSFQWLRNGAPISGAVSQHYRVTPADAGAQLAVVITAAEYSADSRSAATPAVALAAMAAPTPVVTGKPRVGQKLKVVGLTSRPASVAKVQWLRNGAVVPRATGTVYKVGRADRKKSLSVRVTWTAPGYVTASRTAAARRVR